MLNSFKNQTVVIDQLNCFFIKMMGGVSKSMLTLNKAIIDVKKG